jgi:hypothetical protein
VRALAMRLSVFIYGVTTVDIATSAGRKDDEPKDRTVKPTAKSVRTATVCRDEARFRPEHQCLPERQPGRHLQHRPACTATLWQGTYLYVAFRLFRDNGAGYPSRQDRVCAHRGRGDGTREEPPLTQSALAGSPSTGKGPTLARSELDGLPRHLDLIHADARGFVAPCRKSV